MPFELSPEQILVLGAVASALTLVIRLIFEFTRRQKITLPVWVKNLIVFAVSLVIALIWSPIFFPPLPVPSGDISVDVPAYLVFLANCLAVLTAALSFAVFIYNYLIIKVKEPLRKLLRRKPV